MGWIKDWLSEIAKAKEFNAVLMSSIAVIGTMTWIISELVKTEWVSESENNQSIILAAMVLVLGFCAYLVSNWQKLHRHVFKSKHLFVAMPSLSNEPFHVDLLNGIIQSSSRKHKVTFWLPPPNSEYTGAAFQEFLTMIEKDSAHYEGGIILPTVVDHESPEQLVETIEKIKLPIVLVDTLPAIFTKDNEVISGNKFIGYNNETGGKLAAKAMYEELKKTQSKNKNNNKIIVLHAEEQLNRHQSFMDNYAQYNAEVEFKTFICGWQRDRAFNQIKAIIDANQLNNYQGLFAANDEMAIGALEAIQTLCDDQVIKDSFVIVGYDGTPTAMTLLKLKSMPLKNLVIQNGYNLGVKAVSLLERTIEDQKNNQAEKSSSPIYIEPEIYKEYFS